MLWSKTQVTTLRNDPQDAEIDSHKLMLRAGLVRKLAGGLYTFMPLGLRSLRKVERIVREEMDRAGALELLMPALQPREIWDRSGRYEILGDVMFRLHDRQDRAMVLGPTHEEVITDLVSKEITSYRQLPKTFYQIQTKFRDEIRPRFGLMRSKEFIMKDAYSFDLGWDEADASYQAMYGAYERIFERCGLRTKVVEADTGAMGGSWSHEFMVLADSGEDGLVECESCSYAANLERAERKVSEQQGPPDGPDYEPVHTPECRTIDDVSRFMDMPAGSFVKTLVYVADGKPIAALVAGDRETNENKLRRVVDATEFVLADEDMIREVTQAPVGFAGPVGLSIPIYADLGLAGGGQVVTGANKVDTHFKGVILSRDAASATYVDIAVVKAGDCCPKCGGALREERGIEVGHVFKLGTKYTEIFDAGYLDMNGKKIPMVMGCYGIGVSRTLQAVIEQSHTETGIVWPMAVAPYHVMLLILNSSHAESTKTAEDLVRELDAAGVEVLVDDRDERPGVKFKDADLLGFPVQVVVGERSLKNGGVEVRIGRDVEAAVLSPSEAVKQIADAVREATHTP